MTSECLTQRPSSGLVSELVELPLSTDLATLWTCLAQTLSCLADGQKPQALALSTKAPKSNVTTSRFGQLQRCLGRRASTWASPPQLDLDTHRQPLVLTC